MMIGLKIGTTNCKAVLMGAERRVRAGAASRNKLQYRNLVFSTNNTIVNIMPYAVKWRLWVKL